MARKTGLGRGLGALIKEEPAPAGVRDLAVEALQPNRFQPRTHFDDAGLDELAESIRAQGVIQPIVVLPPDGSKEGKGAGGTYTIIAGERRWRAAQRAGLDRVPVVVRETADDRELLELALVENVQREDLDPMEEAEAYQSLQDRFEMSQEQIAKRVGKARSTVANALRLLKLPPEVQDYLREGRLTAGQARPLLTLGKTKEQVALAARAVEEGLTARDLEEISRAPKASRTRKSRTKSDEKPAPGERLDVNTAAAQEKLTRRLQTKVEIRRSGQAGQVRIHFHSEEELIRLYDLLMQREEAP